MAKSNVAFLNTFYIPTIQEREVFEALQSATNNYVREVEKHEKSRYMQIYRINKMIQDRRNKMHIVPDNQ